VAVSPLVRWLIVIIAAIGFAFDIYELLMLPLILRPAIQELGGYLPGSPEFGYWRAMMFYVPAVAGGLIGLFGGWLTDRLGRRRVLTWSIMLYSLSAFLAGFSTSLPMLLVLRCMTFVGVCVEFVAAIAWLAELFPEPHQRERVLGYTQAFSSFGGLMVAIANSFLVRYADWLPPISPPEWINSWWGTIAPGNEHQPWRYTLMSGLVPALPLLLIRPFLPESPAWQQKKNAGTLQRPSVAELFTPMFRRTTIVTTLMFACSYGVAFGAIQHIPEMVPGLADIKEKGKDLSPPKKRVLEQTTAAEYTKVQEIGGLTGRFLLALMAVRIVTRRKLLHVFQVPALFVVPLVFFFFLSIENREYASIDLTRIGLGALPITTVSLGVFMAGLFTVAQFSFWGNYLPLVYPVRLRGTGEGFAANIGGRMIGTAFAAVTSLLATSDWVPGESSPQKFTYVAAAVALTVTAIGFCASFFLPEPAPESNLD